MPDPDPETPVAVTLNGQAIEARPGELVIDAAERNGVYIPRFCYHHRMDPVGMCRMCLVDIDTGRGPALQPSCMVPVAPDMKVETETDRVKKAQDGVLEFLLINHPLDCPVCDKGGECPLQDHTMSFGPGESRFVEEKRHYAKPIPISDLVLLDRERCILCDRCTRFADDVAGDALINFQDRGNGTQVNTFPEHPFASYFSGNTVQICPVGALTATPYRFKARPWDLDVVESTCRGCSVGCRIVIDGSRDEVLRHLGVDSDPVNWSWLCDKGRFGYEAVNSDHRLDSPLVLDGDEQVVTRWSDALGQVVDAVRTGLERSGPTGVAVIGGARFTNESAYAWTKLAKGVIGTDSVDAQLGDGLPPGLVATLPRATIDEACTPKGTVVLLGSDPKDELPVLFLRLRDAVTRRQATLVEISPRVTSISDLAQHSLRCAPGGSDHLVERLLGDDEELADARAALDADHLTIVIGRSSVAESPAAVASAAARLHQAFPNARFLSGLRRSNVHGALDLGMAPGLLPGRVGLDDGREWFTWGWGSVPETVGHDTAGILQAAADGQIDTLFLLGADPLSDFPDRALAVKGLAGARTVVAVDTFLTESNRQADVILPAAGPAEVDGTTTNLEGRVTRLGRKVTAPGVARADWTIAAELADRLGTDLGFELVDDIWEEIEELSVAHAGITTERLLTEPDGLVIGRVDVDAPAEEVAVPDAVEAADAETAEAEAVDGTGTDAGAEDTEALVTDDETTTDADPPAPPADRPAGQPARPTPLAYQAPTHDGLPVDSYSLRLVTVRRLYDQATLTQQSPSLAPLAGADGTLTVNAKDLNRLGLGEGDTVSVSSKRGSILVPVHVDPHVPMGTALMTWNQADPPATDLIDTAEVATEIRLETGA